MALPVSTFVDVRSTIAAGGVPRLPFGRGLLVTIDDNFAAGGAGKATLFNSLNEVSAVITSGDAYDAAAVWFSADPQPQALYIGRWATANVNTSLRGAVPSPVAQFTAANYSFSLNGVNVTPIDLSSAATYAAVAAVIQTAIVNAGFTGATCVVEAGTNRFVITLGNSAAVDPPYLANAGVGTDLVPLLNMGEGEVDYKEGHVAESVAGAVAEMVGVAAAGPPVALMLANDAPLVDPTAGGDTRENLAAYAQAGSYLFGQKDSAAGTLVANETTSVTALAFSREQNHVLATYGSANTYPDIGGLAILSAQNLNQPASITTVHAKAVPGVAATDVTPTQYQELDRKRCNVVTNVGGLSRMVGGFTSKSGNWADAVWWLMWLENEMELAIWNAQNASRRLTTGILTDNVVAVLEKGARSGGIERGGKLNSATVADVRNTTGNHEFNGTLPTGYLLWVERPSQRTDADRENRVANWKAWLSPSEAIHKVFGDLILG